MLNNKWHTWATLYLVREFVQSVDYIYNFAPPTDVKPLKQVLGLSSYYRKYIQGYADIAKPLYKLFRKRSSGFLLNAQCQSAFNTLRQKLIIPPILAYLDFKIPFTMSTDASATAIGAILSQAQDGTKRVLAY